MQTIPLSEAKNTLSALIARVEAGDEVEITRRGRTVARVVPPQAPAKASRSQSEQVRDAFHRILEIARRVDMADTSPESLKALYREGLL
jgi:prevent-host-death family protein